MRAQAVNTRHRRRTTSSLPMDVAAAVVRALSSADASIFDAATASPIAHLVSEAYLRIALAITLLRLALLRDECMPCSMARPAHPHRL